MHVGVPAPPPVQGVRLLVTQLPPGGGGGGVLGCASRGDQDVMLLLATLECESMRDSSNSDHSILYPFLSVHIIKNPTQEDC